MYQKILIKLLSNKKNEELQASFLRINDPLLFESLYLHNIELFYAFYSMIVGIPNSRSIKYIKASQPPNNNKYHEIVTKYCLNPTPFMEYYTKSFRKPSSLTQWKRLLCIYNILFEKYQDQNLYNVTWILCRNEVQRRKNDKELLDVINPFFQFVF